MADVAVLGAGLVGQLAAILLARRGHQVIIFDSDGDLADGTADDDFVHGQRQGVPQSGHGHVFRGRVGRVLREESPDIVQALLAHGIAKAGFDFGEGFQDDFALMARRPVLEAVLRRTVRNEPGVELRTSTRVSSLVAANGVQAARVTGVLTEAGEQVSCELVLDCCGRRSQAPRWLKQIGAELPVNHYQPCELHYYARHYRLLPDADFPSITVPDGAVTPYGIFLAMAGDNRTFCLAGALSRSDPCRPAFRDPATFDRVMNAMPSIQDWAAVGAPMTDIQLMAGHANRRRSLLHGAPPAALGYLLVGDASLYTNATFGQGVALGFWQAQALAHRADLIGRDHQGLLRSHEAWTDRNVGPWYRAQVEVDKAMIPALRAGVAGAPLTQTRDPRTALASMGSQGDHQAASALYRVDNLLSDLDTVLADDSLRARVTTHLETIDEGPAGYGPLSRPQFESLLR